MLSARRKVSAEEAEGLVAEWRASKRALPVWCASRGVDGRSLRYWADRLDQVSRPIDSAQSDPTRLYR